MSCKIIKNKVDYIDENHSSYGKPETENAILKEEPVGAKVVQGAVESASELLPNNEVKIPVTQEDLDFMESEDLIDPLDGDILEEGYLSPVVASKLLQATKFMGLKNAVLICQGINCLVLGKTVLIYTRKEAG